MTTATMNHSVLRATIADWAAAIGAQDAARVASQEASDIAHASLAPPLVTVGPDEPGMNAWFATWRTLRYDFSDYRLEAAEDLAFCHGIARMTGTKNDGEAVDLSFRLTLCLRRHAGVWKIVHEHASVPFHMDGSYRAATELTA